MQSGFSLIEVLVATTLLLVMALGIGTCFLSGFDAQATNSVDLRVLNGFRNQIELMRGTTFEDVIVDYQKQEFTVDSVGATGSIELIVDETRNDADAAAFGLPRDLDGDGVAETVDISSKFLLLPVKLTLSWNDRGASFTRSRYFFLSQPN